MLAATAKDWGLEGDGRSVPSKSDVILRDLKRRVGSGLKTKEVGIKKGEPGGLAKFAGSNDGSKARGEVQKGGGEHGARAEELRKELKEMEFEAGMAAIDTSVETLSQSLSQSPSLLLKLDSFCSLVASPLVEILLPLLPPASTADPTLSSLLLFSFLASLLLPLPISRSSTFFFTSALSVACYYLNPSEGDRRALRNRSGFGAALAVLYRGVAALQAAERLVWKSG